MNIYRTILILSFIGNIVFSQSENRESYDIKSPNVSDFIRYGNIPIKMNSGELDLSIPVLTQGELNLNLSYNSSGFIPNKRSGIYGLNWNLNGIGMITREVNGIPDDHIGAPTTINGINGRKGHGFIVGIQYLKNAGATLPNGIVTNDPVLFDEELRHKGSTGGNENSFETTPDIFNFNINGLSGKFFMTSDGKIKVISNNPEIITVDLSNFNFQPYTVLCAPINISEIILIDSKGNKYFFGGESKYLEYTLNYNKSNQAVDATASNPVINTWHIKKIQYFNGDITTFNYQNDEIINGDSSFCTNPAGSWFKGDTRRENEYKRLFFMTESVNESREMVDDNGIQNTTGWSGNVYTLHKKAFLLSISNPNFEIIFEYTPQGFYFNNNPNLIAFFKKIDEYKLSKIKLMYGTTVVKNIDFTYDILGGSTAEGTYPRLFLKKIIEQGKPPHVFEYDILPNQLLPKPSTCAVDFWGFYNGKLTNDAPPFGYNQLIPSTSIDNNHDLTYTNNIRFSDFNFSKIGMLKKVIYPTGGYSQFEYEPHQYSKRLERKSITNFLPSLNNITGISGGVRIKKIFDFDGKKITNIKTYEYLNSDNSSSGILMDWPRTNFVYTNNYNVPSCWKELVWVDGYSGSITVVKTQSRSLNMNSMEGSTILYSRVLEKTTNNGYRILKFKDYVDYPDINDISNLYDIIFVGNLCGDIVNQTLTPQNLVRNFDVIYNDRSIERGKLEYVLTYSNSNVLIKKEEYFYNTDPNRFNKFSEFANISNKYWWYKSKQYYYSDYLTEKRVTEFRPSGNFVTIDKSSYISAPNYSAINSNQDILSKTFTINSLNDILETEYLYPWQSYLPTSTELMNFKNANILLPIREIQYKNSVKVSEKFTLFSKDATTSNLLLPKIVYYSKFPNSLPPITDIGNLEKKATYDYYDTKGNIIQLQKENGIPISIIWGYNKTLPIAKFENATNSQITSALGISDFSSLNESNLAAINGLRTTNSFSNVLITTYEHIPLVGVSSITLPNGLKTSYLYDSFGRLIRILDQEGKVVEEFQYHFKN